MDGLRGLKTAGVAVFLLVLPVFGQAWDANGVEGDPYQVWTAEDMQAIWALVGAKSKKYREQQRLSAHLSSERQEFVPAQTRRLCRQDISIIDI